ncbi:MAG: PP2C family protein-serine/threonine phosphatase [Halothiobacillaceae bacterium]
MRDARSVQETVRDLTVLVVDDDPAARDMLTSLLSAFFGQVKVASDGQEALAIYRDHPEACDVLVTDIRMPRMDGLTLSEKIRAIDPDQKILIISAHNEPSMFTRAIGIGVDGFIVKPVQTEQIFQALYKVGAAIQYQRESRRYQAHLEEERRIVASLMQGLMPEERLEDPAVSWLLRPTELIGGDMISVFRNGHHQLHVMLCDSTGHGLPAAINLLPLHRIFYSMVRKGFTITAIAEEMQRALVRQVTPGRFVATTLVRVDLIDRVIEVFNAGNPPLLLLDGAGSVLGQFDSDHLPLGIPHEGFSGRPHHYICQEAVGMLLYSDGVPDTENTRGERFGEARLLSTLTELDWTADAALPLAALNEQLESFRGDEPASDDVSLFYLNCPSARARL